MYDTARKIEDNLEMYGCLSRNDKMVTDFRQVEDAGIYLVLVSFATGVHGCRREGVRPFLFSTENSHIVAYSLPTQGTSRVQKGEIVCGQFWSACVRSRVQHSGAGISGQRRNYLFLPERYGCFFISI